MSLDLVKQRIAAPGPGTGPISLSGAAALPGYRTFGAAGAVNNGSYPIHIADGSEWSIGEATYASASGGSLTRTTLIASSTGAALSLTEEAIVTVVPLAKDLFRGFSTTLGNGTDLTFTVTHNLGTRDLIAHGRRAVSPWDVPNGFNVSLPTINTATVTVNAAPVSNGLRVHFWRVN